VFDVVLDASAILARLLGERGRDRVDQILAKACMSAVSYAEVITKLVESGVQFAEAEYVVDRLECAVLDADKYRSAMTGRLHEKTKRTGTSLGDRYCLQLAMELGVPVLTTDRRWASLGLDVAVELIR
jgi:PIN domain nuclease of toxin-antitoxin system